MRLLNRAAVPLSRIYALGMHLRAKAYAAGRLPSWRPPVPCISVGNISCGGSGKTPLCAWLLRWSLANGYRPALLTRGYRAKPPRQPYLVQAGSPPQAAGDEPLMLSRECPQAVVVVDPCRQRAGKWVWERFQPDLFILDDGMQHLGVQRDLDLILLRPEDVSRDWARVIPAGPWREGVQALARASAFVCNLPRQQWPEVHLELTKRLTRFQKPVFACGYTVQGIRRVVDQTVVDPRGRGYLLVSGVGSPHQVEATAAQAFGRPAAAHLRFADHHFYIRTDWEKIVSRAKALGCELIVCTPKDRVKLEGFADHRLCSMDLNLAWHDQGGLESGFSAWLGAQVKTAGR